MEARTPPRYAASSPHAVTNFRAYLQATGAGPLAPGQRWSLARKHEVVLRLLRGKPVEAVSRQFGVPVCGVRGPSPGSRPGCASAPRIPLSASWPRPIGGSVNSS